MALSGKKTTTPGNAVAIGSGSICGPLLIKALPGNGANIYIGDSSVSSANGLELGAGDQIEMAYVDRLDNIYLDSATGTCGLTWLILKA